MKIKLTLFLLIIVFTSCQLIESYRGNEAIKLVQLQKFGVINAYKINMRIFIKNPSLENCANLSVNADPTNLGMANSMAANYGKNSFEWRTKYVGNGTFLVFFFSVTANDGLIWEANINSQIVRCVTCDPELMKEYNFATDTATVVKPRHKKQKRH